MITNILLLHILGYLLLLWLVGFPLVMFIVLLIASNISAREEFIRPVIYYTFVAYLVVTAIFLILRLA